MEFSIKKIRTMNCGLHCTIDMYVLNLILTSAALFGASPVWNIIIHSYSHSSLSHSSDKIFEAQNRPSIQPGFNFLFTVA